MTELEQLRVDLATLEKTSNIYLGAYGYFPAHHDLLIKQTKEKIADLEEQRATKDVWAEIKEYWEGVDGGKVRDDRKAISAEQNRQKLAELTTILNAIPPACGLARELMERRINEVKQEMKA